MTLVETDAPAVPDGLRATAMVLTFRLEGELFALPVEHVHEILDPIERTEVPLAPTHAPALVNVRGVIVPLFDIRHRLRIRPQPEGGESRVVVVEVAIAGAPTKIAIVADSVEAVIEVERTAIGPLPALGSAWPEEFVEGVAQIGPDLVVLLDTEPLFTNKAPSSAA